jgi:hypothetical protein
MKHPIQQSLVQNVAHLFLAARKIQATFLTLSQTIFAENPHHLVDILDSRQSAYCVDVKQHGFIIYSLNNFMIRKNEGRNSHSSAIINYVATWLHREEGPGCAPKT